MYVMILDVFSLGINMFSFSILIQFMISFELIGTIFET